MMRWVDTSSDSKREIFLYKDLIGMHAKKWRFERGFLYSKWSKRWVRRNDWSSGATAASGRNCNISGRNCNISIQQTDAVVFWDTHLTKYCNENRYTVLPYSPSKEIVGYQPISLFRKPWKRTRLKPFVKRSPSWSLELILTSSIFRGPMCSRNQWYLTA